MSDRYPPRWRSSCECGWSNDFHDLPVAEGAANVHAWLKPGHVATVEAI